MAAFQSARFTNADGLNIAYRVWGEGAHTLICVHGLYRNGHDFDFLAAALAGRMRVVTVDMMGRGDSDFSADVSRYNAEFYARDVLALADLLALPQFDLLGTSMGGMVGMLLGMTAPQRLRRLIMNDVGPEISLKVLRELGQRSIDAPVDFARFEDALAYYRLSLREWGGLSEEQIVHVARHSVRHTVRQDGERWVFHYDPRLIDGFRWPDGDVDLWQGYRTIRCPVLVIHGMRSTVLPQAVADKLRREPNTTVLDVADAGHAPGLMSSDQIEAVADFLAD
ncbi:MAG: alpha/beta hydrolase [Proteobacteria bacterium]|nr:alpha/beta hydrolase [Pseudomonadota bacterium]